MTFGIIVLALLPIAAVAYIVWDFRRKTAHRSAARAERLTHLMGAMTPLPQPQSEAPPRPDSTGPSAPAAPPPYLSAPPAARTELPADAPLFVARERVLNPPQTLLYYLLKTGLPDHVVLARVSLASLLEAGPGLHGAAREEQARRLAALTVDFVVADRNMRAIAVVEIAAAGDATVAQSDRASARTRLAAAGVRCVELDATALPRKEAIRAVVLGKVRAGAEPTTSSAVVAR